MKTYVESMIIGSPIELQNIKVTVVFFDDLSNPNSSVKADIYLDKSLTDIEEIKIKAVEKAKQLFRTIIETP